MLVEFLLRPTQGPSILHVTPPCRFPNAFLQYRFSTAATYPVLIQRHGPPPHFYQESYPCSSAFHFVFEAKSADPVKLVVSTLTVPGPLTLLSPMLLSTHDQAAYPKRYSLFAHATPLDSAIQAQPKKSRKALTLLDEFPNIQQRFAANHCSAEPLANSDPARIFHSSTVRAKLSNYHVGIMPLTEGILTWFQGGRGKAQLLVGAVKSRAFLRVDPEGRLCAEDLWYFVLLTFY
ncbi:hypothetical protein EI94DRAFT_1710546 [Lactarius quietus]|nr:hypothetical protein EI94DRAFT_1710546 [Lactarius quietus]